MSSWGSFGTQVVSTGGKLFALYLIIGAVLGLGALILMFKAINTLPYLPVNDKPLPPPNMNMYIPPVTYIPPPPSFPPYKTMDAIELAQTGCPWRAAGAGCY